MAGGQGEGVCNRVGESDSRGETALDAEAMCLSISTPIFL